MASETHVKILFESKALDAETFAVLRFTGEEAISEPYRFEIDLVSEQADIDPDAVLGRPATLSFQRGDEGTPRRVHGILAAFEQGSEGRYGHYHYRAVLVPRLWLLSLSRQNQIYQNKSVVEIVEEELKGAQGKGPAELAAIGLTTEDFEFRLSGSYPTREYVVQYNESDLAFVSRLLEHAGIFYFFEHDETGEKVVFCDDNVHLPAIGPESRIAYVPPSGASADTGSGHEESVQALRRTQRQITGKMILKDYNYRTPTTPLQGEAEIDELGHGLISEYGNHFKTPEEGQALAKVRAQEIHCRKAAFSGAADRIAFGAGIPFTLEEHYNAEFDQDYVLVRVHHTGAQAFAETTGFSEFDGQSNAYDNTFTAIPFQVPFRPARVTPRPRLYGVMNAHVDASGPGTRAEIDEEGRYKLVMPFDLSGQAEGKATRWVRMAQPYGGSQEGMHFPLRKGTEVLWSCVDGDPDRPIITGVVPNPLNKSIVNAESHTKNRIQTASGILIEFEDGPGKQNNDRGQGGRGSLAGQQQMQALAPARPASSKPATPDAEHRPASADVDASADMRVPLAQQQQHLEFATADSGAQDDRSTQANEQGAGRYLRMHVPSAPLDPNKNNPPQTIEPQDPDFTYYATSADTHPADQKLPNDKIESYLRLGANVPRTDGSTVKSGQPAEWLPLKAEPGDELYGLPALEKTTTDSQTGETTTVKTQDRAEGLFDGFIDNISGGNDENGGNPSRTDEASKAKFRNGVVWRDHVSGNRLSTTLGDSVEIITGNHRQVICNGTVSMDAVNGAIRNGSNVPGNVSMKWIETGELDKGGAEGYRNQATWGTTEITRNGWTKSDYEGYQEERFKGHCEENFTGTSNEAFWGKKHSTGGWLDTDLYFGMKLGATYGIDAQYKGGVEVDLHDCLSFEVDNDWKYTFGVEGYFKHSVGNSYEVIKEQDLIAKDSIMLQVNSEAHSALGQWAKGLKVGKKGGGAGLIRLLPLVGAVAGLPGVKEILEKFVDTGTLAGKPTIEITEQKIEIRIGTSSIEMTPAGIKLKAPQIQLNPPGA